MSCPPVLPYFWWLEGYTDFGLVIDDFGLVILDW
jgi:hypothetical protein